MKKLMIFAVLAVFSASISGQGYVPGDEARDFRLKNVDESLVSLADFPDAKGFIVIFTTNHCPYAVAYEDRIIEMDKEFKSQGYPVIAINPNDPETYPADSFENMKVRAQKKGFTFPYLFDETQEIAKSYGAKRTPHVYLVAKESEKLVVKYMGAIDDNYQDASEVKEKYVANAIASLEAGKQVAPKETKAIGCSIKWK
ncbi:thioredoxin family protein [Marinilabilia sp.]|uniref:thioredoxin family protein n=1 Tax=Marinilabilia sp. TaxID=2021252 RepID=UPI0025C0EE08|nr:thioredoxin family protein [Marinilabilia sp.]